MPHVLSLPYSSRGVFSIAFKEAHMGSWCTSDLTSQSSLHACLQRVNVSFEAIKWQDLVEEANNGCNAFRTGAKIHLSEKNILG